MAKEKNVRIERVVAAPLSLVWEVLADYGNVADWNPNLASSRLLEGPSRGVGAQRRCDMNDGKNYVCEVITDWHEQRRMVIEVFEGTMPFEHAEVVLELEKAGSAATGVTIAMNYRPRAGFGGALMGAMAKPMLSRLFGRLFQGLEQHLAGLRRPPGVRQGALAAP